MFWPRIPGENELIQQLQGSDMLIYGIMWSFLIQTTGKKNDAACLVSILFSHHVPVYKVIGLGDTFDLEFAIFSMNDTLSFLK